MKKGDFLAGFPGKLVPTVLTEYLNGPLEEPTHTKTTAFFPDPLPPKIDWNKNHTSRADPQSQNSVAPLLGLAAG